MSDFKHARIDENGDLVLDIQRRKDTGTGKCLWFVFFNVKGSIATEYDTVVIPGDNVTIDKSGGITVRGADISLDNGTVLETGITFEKCSMTRVGLESCNVVGGSMLKCYASRCNMTGGPGVEESFLTACSTNGPLFVGWCTMMDCTIESLHAGYIRNSNCNMCCFKDVTLDDLNPGGNIYAPVFVDSDAGLDNCKVLSYQGSVSSVLDLLDNIAVSPDDIGVYSLGDCVKHENADSAADYIYENLGGSVEKAYIEDAIDSREVLIGSFAVFYFIDGSIMTAVLNPRAAGDLRDRIDEKNKAIINEIEEMIRGIVGSSYYDSIVATVPSDKRRKFILYVATDRSKFAITLDRLVSEKTKYVDGASLPKFDPSISRTDNAVEKLNEVMRILPPEEYESTILPLLSDSLDDSKNDFINNGYERDSESQPSKPHTDDHGQFCGPCAKSCINCAVNCWPGKIVDSQGQTHSCEGSIDIGWSLGEPGCWPNNFDCVTLGFECCISI